VPPPPAIQQPQPAAEPALVDGLTSDEEAQFAALAGKREKALAAQAGWVNVKIEPPHSEMHRGGHIITNDWTRVPERDLAMLAESAADAGVTFVTQEAS
jgi:hypothetical protein